MTQHQLINFAARVVCSMHGHKWGPFYTRRQWRAGNLVDVTEQRCCWRCFQIEVKQPEAAELLEAPVAPTESGRWEPPAIPTGKTAPGQVPAVDVDTITARTINRLAGEVNELMFERDQARRERDDECRINEELRAENMRLRRLLATESDATMPIPRTRSGAANGGRR